MYEIKKNAIAAALAAMMLAAAIPACAETVSANISTSSAQFAASKTVPIATTVGNVAPGSFLGANKVVAVNTIAGATAGYTVVPVAYQPGYRYYRGGRYYGRGGWYPRYRPVYPVPYWGYRYHRRWHRW
jgi:hypothetical protein